MLPRKTDTASSRQYYLSAAAKHIGGPPPLPTIGLSQPVCAGSLYTPTCVEAIRSGTAQTTQPSAPQRLAQGSARTAKVRFLGFQLFAFLWCHFVKNKGNQQSIKRTNRNGFHSAVALRKIFCQRIGQQICHAPRHNRICCAQDASCHGTVQHMAIFPPPVHQPIQRQKDHCTFVERYCHQNLQKIRRKFSLLDPVECRITQ